MSNFIMHSNPQALQLQAELKEKLVLQGNANTSFHNFPEKDYNLPYIVKGNVAIVRVFGEIEDMFSKYSFYSFFSGESTVPLGALLLTLEKICKEGKIKAIILHFNSNGGYTNGVFDAMQTIKELGKQKPIIAYAGDAMHSAAYMLACGCKYIYANPLASVGSIGVIAESVDYSAVAHLSGRKKVTLVGNKAYEKVLQPGNPEFRDIVEERLTYMAKQFYKVVAESRSLSATQVETRFGKGGMFYGEAMKQTKLVDDILSLTELTNTLNK